MHMEAFRHGCLMNLCILAVVYGAEPQFARVQTRVFDIDYAINDAALPVDTVQLWYTVDGGRSWHAYGYDEDRQSPMHFQAPSDGLFGFYFRVTNLAGISGDVPSASTEAQAHVFVDSAAPVVQLHKIRQTTILGRRVVQFRWTAVDSHLTSRPIELEFRNTLNGEWVAVTSEPLANTGRFDWRIPKSLSGRVGVRLVASDQGGHRVVSDPQSLDIVPGDAVADVSSTSVSRSAAALRSARPSSGPVSSNVSFSARDRALQMYREGLAFRDRNDYRRGIARLREAVRLDPLLTDGFAELGGMLYHFGDLDRALTAYEIALDQEPMLRNALQGAAKVYRQKQDYASAARRLRTILRYNPKDAETWMNLGDIGIFQGDELLARECYVRASQIDAEASAIIEQAQKRLALMAEVSRSYVQQKNR